MFQVVLFISRLMTLVGRRHRPTKPVRTPTRVACGLACTVWVTSHLWAHDRKSRIQMFNDG